MEDRPAEDVRLVEAALHGDGAAFHGLVLRYQSMVAGIAWRYGAQRAEVEDMVSEVFLKVYRNLHQYRPEHPFSTWLYRLAANHVLDHARKARKEQGRAELPAEVADPSAGAGASVESQERAEIVRAALREIDPRYREAIFLVYVEDAKVEDAARILGVPEGTVKTRLMRGREALRKVLSRRHPEYFGGPHAVS